jgi:N-acetylglucosaminyldiphosphoundecaprenol N-acetyl-beta-D-mannosaminyltransferase
MTVVESRPHKPTLLDVIAGRAPLVGARFANEFAEGWVSPADARLALGLAYEDAASVERDFLTDERSLAKDLSLALRTVVANALAPDRALACDERPFIVSARVDNCTIEEAIERICAPPRRERARMVHFVHPHALNIATRDPRLRAQLEAADLVLPDGVGLQIAARMLGTPLRHNVNGTDLLPLLCAQLASRGIPLSLIGAAPGVAADCAAQLASKHAGLIIGAVEHGFADESSRARFLSKLSAIGGVVLVGMGTPIQERWAWEHLASITGITVLTVGGLFDFYSGRIPRAPMALREVGLEWTWRLWQEPTRLARRYLVGNPVFLSRALAQRARGRPR